jgi:hypothetical protein
VALVVTAEELLRNIFLTIINTIIMKNYTAQISQVSKNGDVDFNFLHSNEIANDKKVTLEGIADLLAAKLFLIFETQKLRKERGLRSYGLAKTKALNFSFTVDGEVLIDSAKIESIKTKIIIGNFTQSDIAFDILSTISIVEDKTKLA